jgi:hypothetical protein
MPEEKHVVYRRPMMMGDTMYFPVLKDMWDGEASWLDIQEEEVETIDGEKTKKPEEVGIILDKGKHGRFIAYFNPRQQKKKE